VTRLKRGIPKEDLVAEESTAGTKAKTDAPTYSVERLIAESGDFLGHPSHVAAGAFSGLTKKNFTIDEAKSRIDKWLAAPVETDEEAS
jgi:hypothetical protein